MQQLRTLPKQKTALFWPLWLVANKAPYAPPPLYCKSPPLQDPTPEPPIFQAGRQKADQRYGLVLWLILASNQSQAARESPLACPMPRTCPASYLDSITHGHFLAWLAREGRACFASAPKGPMGFVSRVAWAVLLPVSLRCMFRTPPALIRKRERVCVMREGGWVIPLTLALALCKPHSLEQRSTNRANRAETSLGISTNHK